MTPLKELLSPPPPERGPACPPTIVLEEAVAGDALDAHVRAHIKDCPACGPYVATLQTKQDEFRKARPPEVFIRQVERRAKQVPDRPLMSVLAIVFSTFALVLVVPLLLNKPDDVRRMKGGSFSVFYKRDNIKAPQPVAQDLRLKPGDALRFSYVAPSKGYLAILDLDATGKTTVFYPFGGSQPEAIDANSRALLPNSVILDNTLGYEWLVAVFSPSAFEIEPLLRQLREHPPGASIQLSCHSCRVESLRIQKER